MNYKKKMEYWVSYEKDLISKEDFEFCIQMKEEDFKELYLNDIVVIEEEKTLQVINKDTGSIVTLSLEATDNKEELIKEMILVSKGDC